MNEFTELIKEALVGEEPLDLHPGVEALSASVERYERRLRTVRWMSVLAVLFMTLLSVAGVVGMARAGGDAGTRELLVYALLILFGTSGIGMSKMWFAMMLNDIGLRKELKRTQILVLEQARPPGQPSSS